MRETIKYVDADHKFGKTVVYIDVSNSDQYAYKDPEFTEPFTGEELKQLVSQDSAIAIVEGEDGTLGVSNLTAFYKNETEEVEYACGVLGYVDGELQLAIAHVKPDNAVTD